MQNTDVATRLMFYLLILIIFPFGIIGATEQESIMHKDLPGLKDVVQEINNAVTKKSYSRLNHYVPNGERLYWTICGPSDGSPIKYSIDKMTNTLKSNAVRANIFVDQDVEITPWNNEKTVFMMDIETEGWTGEYPYLSFGFQYSKKTEKWNWLGVCYSAEPPIKIAENGKYEQKYKRQPLLPRVGPRTFKNYSPLQARIKEIVRFKAFDALQPYAIDQVLTFGQCNREMMEKDGLIGKRTSVQDVISFLKKNVPAMGEIKSSGIEHKTYYETTGWNGEYPFMAFWFSEGNKGWELAGVSYCKTRHFELFPPLPPLK